MVENFNARFLFAVMTNNIVALLLKLRKIYPMQAYTWPSGKILCL